MDCFLACRCNREQECLSVTAPRPRRCRLRARMADMPGMRGLSGSATVAFRRLETSGKGLGVISFAKSAEDVRRSTQQQTIVAAPRELDEPLTTIQLAELVSMKRPNVRYLLGRLVNEGAVSKTGRGKHEILR